MLHRAHVSQYCITLSKPVRTVPLAPTGAYATETVNTAAIPDGRTELPSPEIASVSDHYGAFLCV